MRNWIIERLLVAVTRSTSSSTRTKGSRSERSAARRGRATSTILGALRDNSSRRSSRTAPVGSSAAATWATNATGSLSPFASCTQPLTLGSRSHHCATTVVFP